MVIQTRVKVSRDSPSSLKRLLSQVRERRLSTTDVMSPEYGIMVDVLFVVIGEVSLGVRVYVKCATVFVVNVCVINLSGVA